MDRLGLNISFGPFLYFCFSFIRDISCQLETSLITYEQYPYSAIQRWVESTPTPKSSKVPENWAISNPTVYGEVHSHVIYLPAELE
jgi:hypothetical protein